MGYDYKKDTEVLEDDPLAVVGFEEEGKTTNQATTTPTIGNIVGYERGDGGEIKPIYEDIKISEEVTTSPLQIATQTTPPQQATTPQKDNTNSGGTPPQVETTTDPFEQTAKVVEKTYGSFSDTLRDMYEKREKAREKRKRTAEKVAIGHALGDLFGAISAHYISDKNSSKAIVPQSLAPKSYEKIQKLIDEGIADQKTFDQYMLSLTQKRGEHDISLAQARGKAAADLAIQKRKEDEAERQRIAEAEALQTKQNFEADQNDLDRKSKEKIVELQAQAGQQKKTKSSEAKQQPLSGWQRRMAIAVMPKESTSTQLTKGVNGLPDTEATTTSHYKPGKEDMFNHYATAEGIAKKWGLDLTEQGAAKFEELYGLVGKKTAKGNVMTIDGITALLNKGFTISQIKEAIK